MADSRKGIRLFSVQRAAQPPVSLPFGQQAVGVMGPKPRQRIRRQALHQCDERIVSRVQIGEQVQQVGQRMDVFPISAACSSGESA